MDKNNYCVIMAGGVGTRFWPMSKTAHPKQFLDVLGIGRTLIQQTYDRLKDICPAENFYVVTNDIYYNTVKEQIPEMLPEHILTEPLRRNTAPCIAYANHKIMLENPDANIIVAPADHLILKEEEFKKTIQNALDFTKNNDALITLGIKPSRPDTGYGYIQVNNDFDVNWNNKNLQKVKTFTEKPNKEMAQFFLDSGDFFWNSGIFVWSLKSINKAFQNYLPDVNNLFDAGKELYNTPKEKEFISKTYPQCQNISIDYGIMEKADNVYILKSDFGWSDLGTWGSLYANREKDENNNVITGDVMTYDSQNCIIHMPEDKFAVIHGLNDYIVVQADNTLLICKKSDEQMIKHFVNDVSIQKGEDYV